MRTALGSSTGTLWGGEVERWGTSGAPPGQSSDCRRTGRRFACACVDPAVWSRRVRTGACRNRGTPLLTRPWFVVVITRMDKRARVSWRLSNGGARSAAARVCCRVHCTISIRESTGVAPPRPSARASGPPHGVCVFPSVCLSVCVCQAGCRCALMYVHECGWPHRAGAPPCGSPCRGRCAVWSVAWWAWVHLSVGCSARRPLLPGRSVTAVVSRSSSSRRHEGVGGSPARPLEAAPSMACPARARAHVRLCSSSSSSRNVPVFAPCA